MDDMVDGAALLRTIEASPDMPVLLPHDQALAIFSALAVAQAMLAGQGRLGIAMLTIGAPRA
ncbi:MAG: hypothetical protein ACRYFW_04115 [Janthinobacterium lividum]